MKRYPSTPAEVKIWVALVPAMTIPFIASLFYFVLFTGSEFSKAAYVGAKFFILLWPLISLWMVYGTFPKIEIINKKHLSSIPAGIITGLTIALIMFGLMRTPLERIILESSGEISVKSGNLGVLEYYWAFAAFLCIFHSLLEEYFWRWFVYGNLRQAVGPFKAHITAGSAFAAHHIVVATQFFPNLWGFILGGLVGIGGIIWSIMYERQGTLAGAWVSHMIVDFAIMVIGHKILFGVYL